MFVLASCADLGDPCATAQNQGRNSGLIVFFTGSTSERRRAGKRGALPVLPSQLTVVVVVLVTVTMVVIVNMVRWVDLYDVRADTGVSGAVLCRIEASPGVPVRGSTKVGRLERGPGLTPFSGPLLAQGYSGEPMIPAAVSCANQTGSSPVKWSLMAPLTASASHSRGSRLVRQS